MSDVEKKQIKKLSIIGFFVISILGTILHFTFEIFDKNIIVGIFSSVNESVFEHLKIAIIPCLIWTFIEFITLEFRPPNLWISLIYKLIAICVIIVGIFYLYTGILGTNVAFIDISLFYLAILFSQIISYKKEISEKVSKKTEEISKYIIIIFCILIVLFTFCPPKIGLFKDNVKSTYGIFEVK